MENTGNFRFINTRPPPAISAFSYIFLLIIFYICTSNLINIILRLIPRLVPTFSPTAIRALIRSSTLSFRHLSRWLIQNALNTFTFNIAWTIEIHKDGQFTFFLVLQFFFYFEIPRRAFLTCSPVSSQPQDLELRRPLSWPRYPPTSNVILTITLPRYPPTINIILTIILAKISTNK